MSAEEGASCPPSSCLGGREGRAGCQGHVLQGLRGAPSSHRPLDLPSPASGPWRGSPHLWLLGNKILGVSDLEAPRARASPPHPGGGHGFPTRPGRTRLTMATVSRLPMVRTARDTRSSGWVSTFSETARSAPQAGQHLCGTTGRQPAPAPDGRGSPPWEAVSRRAGGGGRGGGCWWNSGEASGAPSDCPGDEGLRWAQLTREGPGGSGAPPQPTTRGAQAGAPPRASHSPRTGRQSTGPAPAPARRPPARRTPPGPPSWGGEGDLSSGDHPQGRASRSPRSQGHGHPPPPQTAALSPAKGPVQSARLPREQHTGLAETRSASRPLPEPRV